MKLPMTRDEVLAFINKNGITYRNETLTDSQVKNLSKTEVIYGDKIAIARKLFVANEVVTQRDLKEKLGTDDARYAIKHLKGTGEIKEYASVGKLRIFRKTDKFGCLPKRCSVRRIRRRKESA